MHETAVGSVIKVLADIEEIPFNYVSRIYLHTHAYRHARHFALSRVGDIYRSHKSMLEEHKFNLHFRLGSWTKKSAPTWSHREDLPNYSRPESLSLSLSLQNIFCTHPIRELHWNSNIKAGRGFRAIKVYRGRNVGPIKARHTRR